MGVRDVAEAVIPAGRAAEAVRPFDVAVQRAVGAGLAAALVQGGVVAVLGRALYPAWWWLVAAPATAVVVLVAVGQCLVGRFGGSARAVFALAVGASAAAAAVAAGEGVRDVDTAVLPVVIMALVGIGFLSASLPALLLGGTLVVADTLFPAMLRPHALPALLLQAGIQTVILLATVATGRLARRVAVAEEEARETLVRAAAADRAAVAARAERRELEREMHDTVLNTLAALGRANLADSPAVRARCAADARFLRSLRADDTGSAAVPERLRAAAASVGDARFTIDVSCPDDGWPDLPAPVATALVRATRQALVNSREHSGAGRAELRATYTAGRTTIEIADGGRGTASGPGSDRLGVRRSIGERLADVGGATEIRTGAGVGTTVVLRWPA